MQDHSIQPVPINDHRYILAIDTANDSCGCSIVDIEGGRHLSIVTPCRHGQAEILLPQIQRLLDVFGCKYSDINAVLITCGPGGFTGVRVGVSAARSLALALGIPLYSMSSFEAFYAQASYLAGAKEFDRVVSVIDSRRDELYVQTFDGQGTALGDMKMSYASDIIENLCGGVQAVSTLLVGNGVKIVQSTCCLSDFSHITLMDDVAGLDPYYACMWACAQKYSSDDLVLPIYIRDADVSQPKKAARRLV